MLAGQGVGVGRCVGGTGGTPGVTGGVGRTVGVGGAVGRDGVDGSEGGTAAVGGATVPNGSGEDGPTPWGPPAAGPTGGGAAGGTVEASLGDTGDDAAPVAPGRRLDDGVLELEPTELAGPDSELVGVASPPVTRPSTGAGPPAKRVIRATAESAAAATAKACRAFAAPDVRLPAP